MKSIQALLLLTLSLNFHFISCNTSYKCTLSNRRREFRRFYAELKSEARFDPNFAAGMLRAGFHDCITAQSGKENSGCNGSLRFDKELDDPNNIRMRTPVEKIMKLKSFYRCISYADAFMIAFAASSYVTGGGNIYLDVVDEKNPRPDSDTTDFVNELLDLPSAIDRSFENQLSYYHSKNMDARDLVSSLVVGHSLGSVTIPSTRRIVNFTETSPDRVNGDYCGGLLTILRSKRFSPQLGEFLSFFYLPSDYSLIDQSASNNGVKLLEEYCGLKIGRGWSFFLRFGFNRFKVQSDFRRFAIKLQSLNGKDLLKGD